MPSPQETPTATTSKQLTFEEAFLPGWNPGEGSGYAETIREAKNELDMTVFAPVFALRMIRVDTVKVKDYGKVRSPRDVYNLLHPVLKGIDREHFFCIALNTKNSVMGVTQVSMGDLSSTLVHPREVFKWAILMSAASIVVAHNHPSGDPAPSPEDIAVSKRLAEAGELLGIEVSDHIVIGDECWASLKEKGLF
jgi:DNA repair protein RadC